MPKYLIIASYSAEGAKGLKASGGTARTKAVKDAVESVGGKVESFYWAFGGDDAFVTVELPDNVAAAAIGLTVSSTGIVSTRTVVLLTASEIDEAGKLDVKFVVPGT